MFPGIWGQSKNSRLSAKRRRGVFSLTPNIANIVEESDANDMALREACLAAPNSEVCRDHVQASMDYSAMDEAWTYLEEDEQRSTEIVLNHLFNGYDAEQRFTFYLNDIDSRADFFGGMDNYLNNNGISVQWFRAVEDVSRAGITGLGAEGNASSITFWVGSLLPGDQYAWRQEAGNTLMNDGFENFSNIFNNGTPDPVAWDISQLRNEQTILQPVHERYLGNSGIMDVPFNELIRAGTYLMDDTGDGVGDILDVNSRIEYGCRQMGYSSGNGCEP